MIVVLCGGVGAARLLRAWRERSDEEMVAIVNVGDDTEMHGLTICPDLDSITYHLAGLHNEELGWGLRHESWRTMDRLAELGGDTWFRLGDLDLATHLYRTARLRAGVSKSEVAREIAERLGVNLTLLPVTDDPLETRLATEVGELSFQEYFVRHRHSVVVRDIWFAGASHSRPAPGVLDALRSARRVVVAPSNPLLSIDPVLAVPGVLDVLRQRGDAVAISPLVGGRALKGPADRLMGELGHDVSPAGVARHYAPWLGTMVIDRLDEAERPRVEATGCDVRVAGTLLDHPDQVDELLEVLA
ncbi:MAG: 2-phospho-L-lactate transferase [Acidobacteria bacterium]|nr:2-phospho-L-lactate transferase [Acidobacteriota bacterium]